MRKQHIDDEIGEHEEELTDLVDVAHQHMKMYLNLVRERFRDEGSVDTEEATFVAIREDGAFKELNGNDMQALAASEDMKEILIVLRFWCFVGADSELPVAACELANHGGIMEGFVARINVPEDSEESWAASSQVGGITKEYFDARKKSFNRSVKASFDGQLKDLIRSTESIQSINAFTPKSKHGAN